MSKIVCLAINNVVNLAIKVRLFIGLVVSPAKNSVGNPTTKQVGVGVDLGVEKVLDHARG